MSVGQREAIGFLISCVGGLGFLAGFPGFSVLLNGPVGYMLLGGTALAIILFFVATLQSHKNIFGSVMLLGLFALLSWGATYGTMWYFMTYLPAHDGFNFSLMFETPTNVRNDFVSDVKSGNFDKAYQLLSPDAQNQIPDAVTFRKIVTENNWQPTKWQWTVEKADQEHAEYTGQATYKDARTGVIQVWLDKIDKHWKVSGMNFQPQ